MPLITFEGIDGSGKGTQIRLLRKRCQALGVDSTVFREPGGTLLSERVRPLLLDPALHVEPLAELLLFSAARSQLCEEKIRPLLAEGAVVILDRFYDSTVAYQGGGRQIGDFDWLSEFNRRVTGGLEPDRTYYLRVTLEVAARRRRHREEDRLESGGEAFFERVEAAYERIARENHDRVVSIDGNGPPEEVADAVWKDARTLIVPLEPGS
ncbi:MAG: dTMP kinase [Rhodothermales bacterium]|nr:dTMP kinase [Rhodothermales bacterium]